jgi:hypothetical protein
VPSLSGSVELTPRFPDLVNGPSNDAQLFFPSWRGSKDEIWKLDCGSKMDEGFLGISLCRASAFLPSRLDHGPTSDPSFVSPSLTMYLDSS